MSQLPKRAALAMIRAYQTGISPGLGTRCRFEPSCSAYAYESIERLGVIRGSWAAARRLLRCRPGASGGYDPVADAARDEKSSPAVTTKNGTPRVG